MSNKNLDVMVVGSQMDDLLGKHIVYVQFTSNDEPIKGQLWALTYPGNLTVERWRDSTIRHENGEMKFESSSLTEKFFKSCVRPVDGTLTEFEKTLAGKYGANQSSKINPDVLSPKLFGVWQKLQARFFSGDIFSDVSEFANPTEETSSPEAGKGKIK